MLNYKVTTIDYMFTDNIISGINTLKYKAGKFKVIICKINNIINISKYNEVAIIGYEKQDREYHLILNYYRRV